MHWRWIDRGAEDGATQMAIDQAMILEARSTAQPTFRVYQWHPHCISLGYHQSQDIFDRDRCRQAQVDVVRRPTGGRAVFHAEELTYSAIIPFGIHDALDSAQSVYRIISEALAEAIRSLGVPAQLEKRKPDLRAHYQKDESASCFSATARHEVLIHGKKLIGSAQRSFPWGVLQHGSILIGPRHADLPLFLNEIPVLQKERFIELLKQKTAVLQEFMPCPVSLSSAIRETLASRLHIEFQNTDLTSAEAQRLDALRTEFLIFSASDFRKPSIG